MFSATVFVHWRFSSVFLPAHKEVYYLLNKSVHTKCMHIQKNVNSMFISLWNFGIIVKKRDITRYHILYVDYYSSKNSCAVPLGKKLQKGWANTSKGAFFFLEEMLLQKNKTDLPAKPFRV